MRREAQLLVAALAAFLAAVLVLAGPQPLRALGGLVLVLVLPGAALVAALTRRRPWAAEHLLLAVASSVAACVLGGLLLDRLPAGLTTATWALALAYATVATVALGALRPRRPLASAPLRPRRLARPTGRQLGLLAAAVALAAVAVGIARASEEDTVRRTPVLQLWMLRSSSSPASTTLRIGVDAHHVAAAVYRLEVRSQGAPPTVWQVPVEGPTQWRAIVEVPHGALRAVDAILVADDQPGTVLRRARQWVR